MALVARNGLWLSRVPLYGSNATNALRTDGVVEAVASGRLTLSSLGGEVCLSSRSSNVVIGAGGNASAITVSSNAVVIDADLRVLGVLETVNTNDLNVADVLISVAYGSLPSDATAVTDGAGLLVGTGPATDGKASERSIRWRAGLSPLSADPSVVAPSSAGGASNAGCWDVRGGSLRLTSASSSREVSYGLRVNELSELELFKRVQPLPASVASVASYRRVACFGGVASTAGALQLPTSVNPWF